MTFPRIEDAVGTINSFNKAFETTVPYRPGSLRVWINGELLLRDFPDGFRELGNNRFDMKAAPRTTDTLRVYYISL